MKMGLGNSGRCKEMSKQKRLVGLMQKDKIAADWYSLLESEFSKSYFRELEEFVDKEYAEREIFPPQQDIFNALRYTPYQHVKVVILGQDPYHGQGQAHGLSFSVRPGVRIPPSLKNMFKELREDLGLPVPDNGYLVKWAEEGILLLNTVLTVRKGEAHSHKGKGWEIFTDRIISLVSQKEEPVVFILWGKPAQQKMELIDLEKHDVIRSSHPSPFSASKGFFGSRPFSRTNQLLAENAEKEIDWRIPDLS